MNAEQRRLEEARLGQAPWRRWGPYLSERQWGTVREDYSASGDAWSYFTHDQARSRAYVWGEDGLAGLCDDEGRLCFALALWNGKDPILKERLFGLTNSEGNHGEDVKELYYYLDSTPTHSYMKCLYKYPQGAFPYGELVEENRRRTRRDFEYELLDTHLFDEDRYFDVFVEYAKQSPEDVLVAITIHNRGPERATLQVLPTLWFRNTWAHGEKVVLHPILKQSAAGVISAAHPQIGERFLSCEGAPELLFTDNETNAQRLFDQPNASRWVKDGINDYVVSGREDAVNPERVGTKASAHYVVTIEAGGSQVIRLRLGTSPRGFEDFDALFSTRRAEADEFYADVIPRSLGADAKNVMRQALAGMLWSKQYYYYDVDKWLRQHGGSARRNQHWPHMFNAQVISMPDKWEYPWYAAWDLAFHVVPLTLVDPDFGKQQLDLVLGEQYLHPSGQIPAYEWNFGDVNPPVHAWSTIFTYRLEQAKRGEGDLDWLEHAFHKLTLNFTWWVNRKDRSGNNVFEGGFLGLDNIGVFDRSAPLPNGGYLEQADGTAWMALFALNMFEIATELAMHRPAYAEMCLKFAEHYLWIASSMLSMWDEEDGFFYDVLRAPDGRAERLKVRSIVGLLPLCAVTVLDGDLRRKFPGMEERFRRFLEPRPKLTAFIHDPLKLGKNGRRLGAILNETRLRRVLARMLDESEFLGRYGIRSLSRYHAEHPYVIHTGGGERRVDYVPAESDSGMFGGNSNWRGPIWMPVNALIVRALLQYYAYYGDDFRVECPTGSRRKMTLYEVAEEIARRLACIFVRGADERRPVYGGSEKLQRDPNFRDYVLFYEYFHGDDGAGLGASHQTGWTGVIARMMQMFATLTPEMVLASGAKTSIEPPRTSAALARAP